MAAHPDRPSDRVLLVEGTNDQYVAIHLWQKRRGTDTTPFRVLEKGGFDPLRDSLTSEIKAQDRIVLGIVVDANGNAGGRWAEVADQLRLAGVNAPDRPAAEGTIIQPSGRVPCVGVWIMPDNQSSGEIEDFVRTMIPQHDPIWPLSDAYITGIIEQIPSDRRDLRERKATKAKVHAWLAARTEPRPMGRAIQAGDLSIDGELSKRFTDWLGSLFESR